MLGEYENLIALYRRWQVLPVHLQLVEAAAHAHLGRLEEARASIERFCQSKEPKPDAKTMIKFHLRMMARQEDRDR